MRTAVATGIGLAMPGIDTLAGLLDGPTPGAGPVDPAALIGKKGLRYKDRATQLAMCAADAALRDAELLDAGGLRVEPASVGVVVASNFGNLDTITKIIETISVEGGAQGLSPMDTPNASSNVIASTVAIRFGLRGPNLTVCNGATAGIDAVRWALNLLAAGRSERMLVVGVEPGNDTVRRLLNGKDAIDGAVAVVIERTAAAAARGKTARARFGIAVRTGGTARCLELLGAPTPTAWFGPEGDPDVPGTATAVPRHDLDPRLGVASGAHGVLQCAAAIGTFAAGATGPVIAVSGGAGDDASAGVVLLEAAS